MDLSLRVNRLDYWNVQSEIPHERYLEWLAWTILETERNDPDNFTSQSCVTPQQVQLALGEPVTLFNGRF